MNVEDTRRVYEGKDAFLRLRTSFGIKVSTLRGAVICVLGGGRSSYAVILLVSPLGSLTIAKI